MTKQAEIDYLANLDPAERRATVGKPYQDANCARYLVEIGAVLSLLPPTGRLLDLGCGTGWTSRCFARRGFAVVGVDLAPAMIAAARAGDEVERLEFLVADYEQLPFVAAFDAAVFFDSLHHAVDEALALRMAFRALKPGGVCLVAEPGTGHRDSPWTQAVVRRFGVTEKDMPPARVVALALQAGFQEYRVYPPASDLLTAGTGTGYSLNPFSQFLTSLRNAWRCFRLLRRLPDHGLVRLIK